MTAPKAASKNRYGERFYGIPMPGTVELVELPGASSLKQLLAAPGLEMWKQKNIARQFAKRPDLVMLAGAEDTLYSSVKQALDADQSAANIGTAVHAYAEQYDAGTLLDVNLVPHGARDHFNRYVEASQSFRWRVILAESTVFNFAVGYAGTLDRIYDIPGLDGLVVGDLKTGKDLHADDSLQLAALANAEGIWQAPDDLPETHKAQAVLAGRMHTERMTKKAIKAAEQEIDALRAEETARLGRHLPMPEGLRTDIAVIVHLHDDFCRIYPYRLDTAWAAVQALCTAREWKASHPSIIGPELEPEGNNADSGSDSVPATDLGADGQSAPTATDPATESGTTVDEPVPSKPVQDTDGPLLQDATTVLADSPAEQPDVQLDLDGRRTKVREHVAWLDEPGKKALAENWPAGVPGFKQQPWTHTLEQLDAIEAVIGAVEATSGRYMEWPAEAPRTEVEAVELVTKAFVSPVYANAERQPLIDRVTALPADLQDLAAKQAKEYDIPNLRSTKLTIEHAAMMSAVLDSCELVLADRNTVKEQGALL